MYNHDFLQDLWYSGIHPQREAEKEFPDLLSQARIRKEAENEFIESLSEEQKERFHHYKSLVEFEDRMRQEGAFRSGFRLGVGRMEKAARSDRSSYQILENFKNLEAHIIGRILRIRDDAILIAR